MGQALMSTRINCEKTWHAMEHSSSRKSGIQKAYPQKSGVMVKKRIDGDIAAQKGSNCRVKPNGRN
jgi:hypothetical protein